MTNDTIFQPTDLATNRRVAFLEAARHGKARLRDKDGTSLVMVPERVLDLLEALRTWSCLHLRLDEILSRQGIRPTIRELGDLAWLRAFDMDDLRQFAAELHEALVAAMSDEDTDALDDLLKAWRQTAKQLEDPLRRRVLLGRKDLDDFEEVDEPR